MQGFGRFFRSLTLGIILSSAFAFTSQDAFAQPPVEQPKIFEGIDAPTYLWEPSNGAHPKAIILGLHGGVLHGRSFEALATDLASEDVMFASLDLRGFGKWKYDHFGSKRDEKIRYKESLEDVKSMLVRLREHYPDIPIVCLGESLGSQIAFKIGREDPALLDGIVAAGPFSNFKAFLSPRMLVNGIQIAINPFGKLNLEPYLDERLSNNPEEVATQFADPYNRNKQSIGELLQSLLLTQQGKSSAFKLPTSLPVLVVVGDEDNLAGYKGTVKKFHKMKGINNQLAVLHGSGHLIMEASKPEARAVAVVSDFVDNIGAGVLALKHGQNGNLTASKTKPSSTEAKPDTVSLAPTKRSADISSLP